MDTNDDNYYNILIRAELNTLSGIECLLIDNFIKIVNLFKNCPSLSIGSPKNLSIAYN